MKLAVGCDPNATALKQQMIAYVESLGHECADFGSDDPIYANTAIKVAEAVASGKYDRGILFCGTGIEVAKMMVKEYLSCTFDPNSRSAPKIERIYEYEKANS